MSRSSCVQKATRRVSTFAVLFLCLSVVAGCNDGGSGSLAPDLSAPITRAHDWLDRPDLELVSSLMLAGLRPMYGLQFNNDPAAIFEQHLADLQASGQPNEAGTMSLFRRIYDGTVVFDPYYWSLAGSIDQSTLQSLYCDSVPVPADYANQLLSMSGDGGYHATHAMLAALFLRSNGCQVLSSAEIQLLESRTAAVIDLGDGFLDDVDIEAMTMLAFASRLDLVPMSARQALLATQQADGSWVEHSPLAGEPPTAGFQHATGLAYSFLLVWQANGVFIPLCPRMP